MSEGQLMFSQSGEAAEAATLAAAQPIPEGYTHATLGFSVLGAVLVVAAPGLPAMAFHPPMTPHAKGEWRRVVTRAVQA